MTRTFKTALVFLALGAAVPAVGQDRLPRAGGPVASATVIETAPVVRRPRAGATVVIAVPASTDRADDATDLIVDATLDGDAIILCGRKYCRAGSGR